MLRRRPVLGALAGLLASSGTVTAKTGGAASDGGKPQFQGDAANSGYCPTECPPTANLTQEWEIETFSMTNITLTAVGDSIYGIGENTGVVQDVDPDSGSIRWRRELDDKLENPGDGLTCPGTVGDTVYLGAGESWDDGRNVPHGVVYALDADSGSTQWSVGVGRGPAFVTPVDDTVYTGSLGALYALDADDGSSRWNDTPTDSDALIEFPAVDDGTVYYTTDAGRAYALDADDGDRQWSTDVDAGTPPSVADGLVYVGEGDNGTEVRALDADDGSQEWEFDAPGPVTHPPAVADGRVFTFVREETSDEYDDGVLTALDASSGKQLWEFETPGIYVGPLPPLVAGTRVIVVGNPQADYANAAYIVDATSGTLEEQVEMHPDVGTAAPLVVDDTLVIGDDSTGQGFLSAYTGETDCDGGNGGDGGDGGIHTLMITANGPTEYTLGVDGSLEPDTKGGAFSAESSDAPEETSDGTWQVSDETGPVPDNAGGTAYYGDRFLFAGSITDLQLEPASGSYDVNVYLDEELVSSSSVRDFSDPDETHTLMITANGPTEYTLEVDGSLDPDTEGGAFSAESSDKPEETSDGIWMVSDETGPAEQNAGPTAYYGDRFLFSGSITDLEFEPQSDFDDVNVYLDEADVSRSEALAFDG